jgi:hypothetical protein
VQFDSSGTPSNPQQPREILSPVIPRNGVTSLQISVRVQPEQRYFLYIRQNPGATLHISASREEPDGLKRTVLPFHGSGPQAFWMDLRAERNATVQRVKVEPQIRIGDDWFTYPMEARVIETTLPSVEEEQGTASPASVMRRYLCETPCTPFF